MTTKSVRSMRRRSIRSLEVVSKYFHNSAKNTDLVLGESHSALILLYRAIDLPSKEEAES
jgi:hypothetical protein